MLKIIAISLLMFFGNQFTANAADSCLLKHTVDLPIAVDERVPPGLLTRTLIKLGLAGATERTQTEYNKDGAILELEFLCRKLEDLHIPEQQLRKNLKEWAIGILTYSPGKSGFKKLQSNGESVIGRSFAPVSPIWSKSLILVNKQVFANDVTSTVLSPPPPPPRGATILQLFLKKNLSVETSIELRKLLPNFDIRFGRSNVGPNNPVDVLFVDRDKVNESAVLDVLRALTKEGIQIKSLQQAHFQQPKIQVGTILGRQSNTAAPLLAAFARTPALDIDKLATLSGNEFWKTALNGQAWCPGKRGAFPCSISTDGRAVPNKSR